MWYPVAYVVLQATISPLQQVVKARDVTKFYTDLLAGFQETKPDVFTTGYLPPRSASLTRNRYYQADELSLTLAGDWVQFDPRIIRSMTVEYYLASVPARIYSQGGQAVLDEATKRKNLRFLGIVDSVEERRSNDGIVYNIKARDYTALLADYVVQPEDLKAVNWKMPLMTAIGQLVSRLPATHNLHVVVAGSDLASELSSKKVPLSWWANSYMRKHDRQTFWDLVQDVVMRAGLIAFVDLDQLVIARPSDVFDSDQAWVSFGTGDQSHLSASGAVPVQSFRSKGRKHPGGGVCTMPVWVFGYDIEELTRAREFGRVSVPVVEVRSLGQKGTVKGQWPQKGKVSGQARSIRRFVVPGLQSDTEAETVAKQIWTLLARQQVRVSVSTLELGSWGADDTDPDVLDYRAGQPIEILMSDEPVTKQALIRAGVPENKASKLAAQASSAGIQNKYYLGEIGYGWSAESGLQISMKLANYIEAEVIR